MTEAHIFKDGDGKQRAGNKDDARSIMPWTGFPEIFHSDAQDAFLLRDFSCGDSAERGAAPTPHRPDFSWTGRQRLWTVLTP